MHAERAEQGQAERDLHVHMPVNAQLSKYLDMRVYEGVQSTLLTDTLVTSALQV